MKRLWLIAMLLVGLVKVAEAVPTPPDWWNDHGPWWVASGVDVFVETNDSTEPRWRLLDEYHLDYPTWPPYHEGQSMIGATYLQLDAWSGAPPTDWDVTLYYRDDDGQFYHSYWDVVVEDDVLVATGEWTWVVDPVPTAYVEVWAYMPPQTAIYGQTESQAIPEPTAWLLLGLGGLVLRRR